MPLARRLKKRNILRFHGAITPIWQLLPPASPVLELGPSRNPPVPRNLRAERSRTPLRLNGEVVLNLVQLGGDLVTPNQALRTNLGYLVRLNLATGLHGNDRLQTVNSARFDWLFGTASARLALQSETQNWFDLSRLDYRFSISDRTRIAIHAVGGSISDIADPLNVLLSCSGQGDISRFSQRNPLFCQGGGAGVGVSHGIRKYSPLHLGYFSEAEALFSDADSESAAFAQLTHTPTANILNLAITLSHRDILQENDGISLVIGSPQVLSRQDNTSPLHIELLYRLLVNHHIALTP